MSDSSDSRYDGCSWMCISTKCRSIGDCQRLLYFDLNLLVKSMKVTQQHIILNLDMVLWSSSWWIFIFHFIKNSIQSNWIELRITQMENNDRWRGAKWNTVHHTTADQNDLTLLFRVDGFDDDSFYVSCDWQARWEVKKSTLIGKLAHSISCFSISCHDYDLCEIPNTIVVYLMFECKERRKKNWDKFYIIEESSANWSILGFFQHSLFRIVQHLPHCCTVPNGISW